MSYLYKIGYGSYEESEYTELAHDKKFSEAELQVMICDCAVKSVKMIRRPDTEEGWDWVHNYQDIDSYVISYLMDDYGFEKVGYEAQWSCFGWPSIFTKDDWSERGESINAITDAIIAAGFTIEDDSHLSEALREKRRGRGKKTGEDNSALQA